MANEVPETEDEAAFARTGMGCPLGLFTVPVKAWIDPVTHAAWLRLCHSKEVTSSELLRDVIYLLVHGKTPAELVADDRRALLKQEGPNSVLHRLGGRS